MISQQPQGSVLRLGKVVKVHPSDHSVDLVMMDNGAKIANVQIISSSASTRAGRVDLPTPDIDINDPWSAKMSETHDVLALVAMMDGTYIGLGFLYPQVNQLAMHEGTNNLKIERHSSDLYIATDDSANMATHHPWGAYTSIGAGVGAPSISKGSDFDGKWELCRNKRSVATIAQYTPLKIFTINDDNPCSSGEVVGHGKSEITPSTIKLEVMQLTGDVDERDIGTVEITKDIIKAAVESAVGGSSYVYLTKADLSAAIFNNITMTAGRDIRASAKNTVRITGNRIELN